MNENIMHHKIGYAIEGDPNADVKHKSIAFHEVTYAKEYHRYTSEHHKEVVVLLKEMWILVVVIFVQVPKKPMHDVFMCEPGNTFHDTKCDDNNTDI
jgi:hypothetical protein